jgi:hypothetical protein
MARILAASRLSRKINVRVGQLQSAQGNRKGVEELISLFLP